MNRRSFIGSLGSFMFFMVAGCSSVPPPPSGGTEPASRLQDPSPAAGNKQRLILIAVDVSGSTKDARDQYVQATYDISMKSDPKMDHLKILKFASSVIEFHDGNIDDNDAFSGILDENISSTDNTPGTDYSALAISLAELCSASEEADVFITVIGDGQNDYRWDAARSERYQEAASKLSSNPRIKLLRFWGVDENPKKWSPFGGPRKELQHVFAALKDRLQIRSTDQAYI